MEYKRQSRPGSGLGFQIKVHRTFEGVPSSLGRGYGAGSEGAGVETLKGQIKLRALPPALFSSEAGCDIFHLGQIVSLRLNSFNLINLKLIT